MPNSDNPKKPSREDRLAEQLRANLRRRKAAVKRRRDGGPDAGIEPGGKPAAD